MKIITKKPIETIELGEKIGKIVPGGKVIALFGDLGAGKTTFVQGIAKGMGIIDYITSPTFTIISEFEANKKLCHIDLYRLDDEAQIEELGIEDYFCDKDRICVVEWAEKLGSLLPEHSIKIKIDTLSESERKFTIEGIDLK